MTAGLGWQRLRRVLLLMLTSVIDKFVALWKGFMDCAPWVAD